MTAEEAIRSLRFLLSYEEMPNHPREVFETAIEALEKVEEYKDLEEQGLLLRLPCKVGDTLYHILTCTTAENFGGKYIDWFIVTHLTVNITKEMIIMGRDASNREWGTNSRGIGKTVFLTKEEAEQKLKEMEE